MRIWLVILALQSLHYSTGHEDHIYHEFPSEYTVCSAATNSAGTTVATDSVGTKVATDSVGTKVAMDSVGTTVATDSVGTTVATDSVGTKVATDSVGTKVAMDSVGPTVATDSVGTTAAVDDSETTAARVITKASDVLRQATCCSLRNCPTETTICVENTEQWGCECVLTEEQKKFRELKAKAVREKYGIKDHHHHHHHHY